MKPLLYLAKNIIRSNFKRGPYPFKLTFIVTYKCNLRCKMCNIWGRHDDRGELTLGEIEKFFNKSNFFSWINISGGEIFLRKDTVDIVKVILSANKKLYLLDFPTNGFMTDSIIKGVSKILEYKPKRLLITVSLDGPAELHNELRGNKDAWGRAIETFVGLRKLNKKNSNMQAFFGLTVMPQNQRRLAETFDSVKSKIPGIRHDDFHVNIAHDSEHYYDNVGTGYCAQEESYGLMKDFLKMKKHSLHPVAILERRYQRLIKDYFKSKKSPLTCKALSSSCFIDPYGDIFPCSIYNRIIGNLRNCNFDLKKIWNSEEAKRIQNEIAKGVCPQCWTPCEAYQTLLGNLAKW